MKKLLTNKDHTALVFTAIIVAKWSKETKNTEFMTLHELSKALQEGEFIIEMPGRVINSATTPVINIKVVK